MEPALKALEGNMAWPEPCYLTQVFMDALVQELSSLQICARSGKIMPQVICGDEGHQRKLSVWFTDDLLCITWATFGGFRSIEHELADPQCFAVLAKQIKELI